jgi:predicted nucleic acid-binding protein
MTIGTVLLGDKRLVKLYFRETGTERLLALATRSSNNRFTILSLAQVELRSAVRRREENGEIPRIIADQLLRAFRRHLESKFAIQGLTDFVLDVASELVDRHMLRAFDAMQLAGYIVLRGASGTDVPFFVCADQELLDAAQREGAPILNPCN